MMMNFIKNFKLLYLGESLKSRILRGGIWFGTGSLIENAIRFLRNMILARLLDPRDFGLLAIVLAVNTAFESFTELGIKEAIVQDQNGSKQTYLNGAWWLAFIRGTGLFILALIVAPWVSHFYDSPELLPIMRLAFLSIIFNGAVSAKAYVALKEMNFKRWVWISQGGGILGVVTAIVLTFFFKNVWALVLGFVVESVARCFLSYIICPFLPSFKFERIHLQSLWGFASGMFGLPVLFFIYSQADIFVVGKLLSKNELGLYSLVASLAQIPSMAISVFINPIMMPVFSKIKGENEKINLGIVKITSLIAFLGFPVFVFVVLYGRDILSVVYGERYGQLSIPFAIIFGTTILRTCSAPIATAYLALGQPRLQRVFTGVRALLMVLLIFPAVKYFGLVGAASAGLISISIAYIFQIIKIKNFTDLRFSVYSTAFLKAAVLSLPILAVWRTTYGFSSSNPLLNIVMGLIMCVIVYLIILLVFLQIRRKYSDSLLPSAKKT